MLLEGEALMVYLEMRKEDQTDYNKIVKEVKAKLKPKEARFKPLKDFKSRKQLPDKSPLLFLFI